jgi:hypothetical protein
MAAPEFDRDPPPGNDGELNHWNTKIPELQRDRMRAAAAISVKETRPTKA